MASKNESKFYRMGDWIRDVEYFFLNILTAIAPWLAPIPPAYGTYFHVREVLLFPAWVAVTSAIVAEILGLATVSTAMTFWRHNKRYTAKKAAAPTWVPIAGFLYYLVVIVSVNIIVDIIPQVAAEFQWVALLVARSLIYTLTIPAAALLAVRADQAEIINSYRRPAQVKTQDADAAKPAPQVKRRSKPAANTFRCAATGCGKAYPKQQSLAAHFRHNPTHKPKAGVLLRPNRTVLTAEETNMMIMDDGE